MVVSKRYLPRGDRLSSKFGKDTGAIIAAAKNGNLTETTTGITVHSGEQQRELSQDEYEIRYE
ncbi:MAG: hypothetical protein H6765_00645 [Candidatus Peribacteria bacterium]|nr:MAG: hypothetical protein H6765_00645 [Candidatus Peribacteria bacterium]